MVKQGLLVGYNESPLVTPNTLPPLTLYHDQCCTHDSVTRSVTFRPIQFNMAGRLYSGKNTSCGLINAIYHISKPYSRQQVLYCTSICYTEAVQVCTIPGRYSTPLSRQCQTSHLVLAGNVHVIRHVNSMSGMWSQVIFPLNMTHQYFCLIFFAAPYKTSYSAAKCAL